MRPGAEATSAARISDTPTSHVDLIPTLLAAVGIDQAKISAELALSFTEVHPLPGRDLTPLLSSSSSTDSASPGSASTDSASTGSAPSHAVYLMTRDNVLEGDSSASGFARRFGIEESARGPLAISVPAYVGANFEGIVTTVTEQECSGGAGQIWKLVRSFDDPTTWTTPGVRQLSASGPGGPTYRTGPLA